jgi:hypothetical protein
MIKNYKVNFINASYRRYYKAHKKEILKAIDKCFSLGNFVLRKDVLGFEGKLAKFVGTKYAVGVNSGTDALKLSYKALGCGLGDEVITVGHTFISFHLSFGSAVNSPIIGLPSKVTNFKKASFTREKRVFSLSFYLFTSPRVKF